MTPAEQALSIFMDLLHVALLVAVGVFAIALAWQVGGVVSRRLEDRYLPRVARWSRRRAGLGEDAGPWACAACSSVNPPTGVACYRCGGAREEGAAVLLEAAADDTVFHRPEPRNRFDPSLYRGPGAPPEEPGAEALPEGAGGDPPQLPGAEALRGGAGGAAGSPGSPMPPTGSGEPVR